MVSPKAVPAVWAPGLATVNELAPAAATVKLVEVPVTKPWVAASVVDWASVKVMPEAEPTPAANVTEAG